MAKNRTALRVVNILELIAKSDNGISLTEIANKLQIPVSSTKDILESLVATNMICTLNNKSKLYKIDVQAFIIGQSYVSDSWIVDICKPIIEDLGSKLNKTVFLGTEVDGRITYIYKYEPKDVLVATCKLGSTVSMDYTALGKSYLAFNEKLLNKTKKQALNGNKDLSHVLSQEFSEEIEKVRKKGFAIGSSEHSEQLICIGAPIFNNSNEVIAAMSVTGLKSSMEDVEVEALLLKEKANLISEKLGQINL